MEKRGRVQLTLFKLSGFVVPEANTPLGHPIYEPINPIVPNVNLSEVSALAIKRRLINISFCLYFIKLRENQKELFISKRL